MRKLLLGLIVMLTACGGQPVLRTYSVSSRSMLAPPKGPAPARTMPAFPEPSVLPPAPKPKIEEHVFPNGVRLRVSEEKGMPLVSVTVASSLVLPMDLSELRAEAIGNSTSRRDSNEIWTALGFSGARVESTTTWSSSNVSVSVLSDLARHGIETALEFTLDSTFEAEAVDKVKNDIRKGLTESPSLSEAAEDAMRKLLYPADHPYSQSERAIRKAALDVPRDKLKVMQSEIHDRAPLVIAIAGNCSLARAKAIVEPIVNKLPKRNALPDVVKEAPPLTRSVLLLDKKGASQAYVLLGAVGVHDRHADYPGLKVAVAHMGERVRFRMRFEKGASYGGGARLLSLRGPGPALIGGQVEVGRVGEILGSLLTELQAMSKTPLSEADSSNAKERLREERDYERTTNLATSRWMASLAAKGWGIDEAQAQASTDEIRRAAATYLPADRVPIVVVGDQEKIAPQLKALKIGDVRVEAMP